MRDGVGEVTDRIRAALTPGGAARRADLSRGVSYAPADVAHRLRRVSALRRAALGLRRAGEADLAVRVPHGR